MRTHRLLAFAIVSMNASPTSGDSPALGLFSAHRDVGSVQKPGAVEFDSSRNSYLITGGGENIWSGADSFHFVWKEMSGDLALTADVRWIGAAGQPHRKACLLIRQTLAPDSPYVDVALHGNGLTSLQYRETAGGTTREIQSNITAPRRVQIQKRGGYISLAIAAPGEEPRAAGGSVPFQFQEPFYVGLGVCAHDNTTTEKALFSNVKLTPLPPPGPDSRRRIECTLETLNRTSLERRVIRHTSNRIEAPNWSRNGQFFIYNSDGLLYRIPVTGGQPSRLDTGPAIRCNNDHGISPDGLQLAISHQTDDGKSRIYILPIRGGTPRLVTPLGPSYWHGWSPDGKTLAYCAERNGQFDIYTIPAAGGDETRLTTAPGHDDGPDYSPDGKFIYFNSDRTGLMQIWRMNPDGSDQQQVMSDDSNNWFPHPSPDGRWIVFLTYPKDVKGHPQGRDVMLRLMPAAGNGDIQVLAKLFGGQGTINVPSWSPDSQRIAFVSYQLVYP